MFEDNPNLNNTNLENNIFIIFDSFQHFSKHSLTQITPFIFSIASLLLAALLESTVDQLGQPRRTHALGELFLAESKISANTITLTKTTLALKHILIVFLFLAVMLAHLANHRHHHVPTAHLESSHRPELLSAPLVTLENTGKRHNKFPTLPTLLPTLNPPTLHSSANGSSEDTCLNCDAGTSSLQGSTSCSITCSSGSYSPAGSLCIICEQGKFNENEQQVRFPLSL